MSIRVIKSFLLLTMFSVLVSCASRPEAGDGYVDNIPQEIRDLVNQKYANSLYAVGTANGPNESIAENKATLQARSKLSQQFSTMVSTLQKSYEEAVNEAAVEDYKQTIKAFSHLELKGSKVVKTMIRQEGARAYSAKALIVVDHKVLADYMKSKLNAYTSFKSEKNHQDLDKHITEHIERQKN